ASNLHGPDWVALLLTRRTLQSCLPRQHQPRTPPRRSPSRLRQQWPCRSWTCSLPRMRPALDLRPSQVRRRLKLISGQVRLPNTFQSRLESQSLPPLKHQTATSLLGFLSRLRYHAATPKVPRATRVRLPYRALIRSNRL